MANLWLTQFVMHYQSVIANLISTSPSYIRDIVVINYHCIPPRVTNGNHVHTHNNNNKSLSTGDAPAGTSCSWSHLSCQSQLWSSDLEVGGGQRKLHHQLAGRDMVRTDDGLKGEGGGGGGGGEEGGREGGREGG